MTININHFLTKNSEELHKILDLIPVPIFIKSRLGVYTNCNWAFERFVNSKREDIVGRTVYDLWETELAELYHEKDEVLFNNPGEQVYESKVMLKSGKEIHCEFHKSTHHDNEGNVTGLVGVIFDRTIERRKTNELRETLIEMDNLTRFDSLTAIYNKNKLDEELLNMIEIYHLFGKRFGVLVINIDDFKVINEKFNDDIGDKVLQEMARFLGLKVNKGNIFGRLSGDEFLVISPNMEKQGLLNYASHLKDEIELHDFEIFYPVKVSIGASIIMKNDTHINLMQRAERALFNSKFQGKNKVTFL